MQRNRELEAKLIEDPNDVEAYLVYADWLQSHGDRRGEWIVMQARGREEEAQEYFEEHEEELLGSLAPYATSMDGMDQESFQFRYGFIRSARLSYDSNCAEDGELSLESAVGLLLQHPLGVALEELVIPINMLDDGCYFEPLVKSIAEFGAPALRRLRIGEFQCAGPGGVQNGYDYEISWSMIGDATGMWKKLPRLEYLRLQSGLGSTSCWDGHPDTLGQVHLPGLKHLEIVTGGMAQECLRSIANADWPALEHLELWLGSSSYGFDATADDLARIMDGAGLPRVAALGLKNAELTDELCAMLGHSKILPRLKTLSLAHGTMSDEGAQRMAARREAFAHLAHLELDQNFLSAAGIEAVSGLCANVTTEGQKEAWEGGERYVSLSE